MKPQLEELECRVVPSATDLTALPAPFQAAIPQMQAAMQGELNQIRTVVQGLLPQTQAVWNALLTTWQEEIGKLPALVNGWWRQEVFLYQAGLFAQLAQQSAAGNAFNTNPLMNAGGNYNSLYGNLDGMPSGLFPYNPSSTLPSLPAQNTNATIGTTGSTGGAFGSPSAGVGLYTVSGALSGM